MLKYCGVLVLSITFVISSAGCGMGNNNVKTNEYQGRSADRLITQDLGQKRTHASYNKIVSDKITTDVLAVKGISKATVIVYNRNAIVGIDVSNATNKAILEHKVAKTVNNSDPGYVVHVTADNQLYTRIESIRNQITLHPSHDFSGDIRTLIQDIDLKVTAPTPTPTPSPTPRPKHWHKPEPTPTPTPKHWHKPEPTPTPTPRHNR